MYIVCVKCLEKIEVENKKNYVLKDKNYYHNDCYFELKKKNLGIVRDRFSGLTNYVVNREWTDRITGDATFFWNNLNDLIFEITES